MYCVLKSIKILCEMKGSMEIERVKVLAKSVDFGIAQIATERTKLLTKSFNYGSRDWLTTNTNSKECIVQMPQQNVESLYR